MSDCSLRKERQGDREELGFLSWCTYLCGFKPSIPYLIPLTVDCLITVISCHSLSLSPLPFPLWQCKVQYVLFYLLLVVHSFCVTVLNYCIRVGCSCFVFVPLLFTMFPIIDQVTATVPCGVYWCFLLSFNVVVLITIRIISIACFFLFLYLSPYKSLFVLALLLLYMFVVESIFDYILCCYFCWLIFIVGSFFDCLDVACLFVVGFLVVGCCMVVFFYEFIRFVIFFNFGMVSQSVAVVLRIG